MTQDVAAPHPIRMRRSLMTPLLQPLWPSGVRLARFGPADAPEVHALLELAYAAGGGAVLAYGQWWQALAQDAEYDPALCFLVRDERHHSIGVAQCWTTGFVKDLAVHPGWRRRGLARALLQHAFSVFKARGAEVVDLKVDAGNAAAIALYKSVGMREV